MPLLTSSSLFLASSWPLFQPLPGLFWPLRGLFGPLPGLFWPLPGGFSKISKIEGHPETSFSVHKTLRFEQFFAKFWIPGLLVPFWPLPGLFLTSSGLQRCHILFIKQCVSSSFSPNSGFLAFWCLFGLFLVSSWPLPDLFWPLPGLSWPLLGLLLAIRHILFIKQCVSSSFSPNFGFLAFWCLFGLFLASS